MTTTVPLLPTPIPSRNDPNTFAARADASMAQLNATLSALNVQNVENNTLNSQVQVNADLVSASAALQFAAANFAGEWAGLTGARNIPTSVRHVGRLWMLLQNLANVASQTPADGSAYWMDVTPVSQVGGVITGGLQLTSINGGPVSGFRNWLINGDFAIHQYDSDWLTGNQKRFFDMWQTTSTIAGAPSNIQTNRGSLESVRIGTPVATLGAGEFYRHTSHIEGYNASALVGKDFTLSFEVSSSDSGVHCVSLRNFDNTQCRVFEYTLPVTGGFGSVWTKVSIFVSGGLPSTGFNDNFGVGLELGWTLAAGSSLRGGTAAWAAGGHIATANQVNKFVSTGFSQQFAIREVQVELGPVATKFERRPYHVELAACRRYYRLVGGYAGWSTTTTTLNGFAISIDQPMRIGPVAFLRDGTAAAHNPSVAFRDISTVAFSGDQSGGYLSCTCTATTANRLHNIVHGKIALVAHF